MKRISPTWGLKRAQKIATMVEMIRDEGLNIRPAAAGRTHPNDIKPIIEISEKTVFPLKSTHFLAVHRFGYLQRMGRRQVGKFDAYGHQDDQDAGLPFAFVTEDTIRSHPPSNEFSKQPLKKVPTAYVSVIPLDTQLQMVYSIDQIHQKHHSVDGNRYQIDWHGHSDRGLGLVNAMYAIEAGADQIHGIGNRRTRW